MGKLGDSLGDSINQAIDDLTFNYKPVITKNCSPKELRNAIKEVGRRISVFAEEPFFAGRAQISIEKTNKKTFKVSYNIERTGK